MIKSYGSYPDLITSRLRDARHMLTSQSLHLLIGVWGSQWCPLRRVVRLTGDGVCKSPQNSALRTVSM